MEVRSVNIGLPFLRVLANGLVLLVERLRGTLGACLVASNFSELGVVLPQRGRRLVVGVERKIPLVAYRSRTERSPRTNT